jgi:hypothetical protein
MRSHFRLFDRAGLRCARDLKVTIQTRGTISLTWFAYESLRCPRLVRPSFDERSQVLKIGAARVEDEHTSPVRQERGSTCVIAASKFTQRFGIDTTTARRYEATAQDGKLLVDLKQEPELVSKPSGKKKGTDQVAPADEEQAETGAHSLPQMEGINPEEFMQVFLVAFEQYKAKRAG